MDKTLKEMGFVPSFTIYLLAALLMFFMTHYLIPFLSETTGQEMILFWFIVAGLGIFLPLVLLAVFILRREGHGFSKSTWIERLRFRKLNKNDLTWTIGGIFIVLIFSGMVMAGLELIIGKFDHSPSFMVFEPLSVGRFWLLAVWLPYWVLNIMGEEILWRGVMLPRQEISFGKYAWLVHGFGWGLFHIAFGWQLLVTLVPLLFTQSYVVQKTKNSWTGVIMHAGINGPSFLAISFGLI